MINLDLQITNDRRYPIDSKRLFGVVENVLSQESEVLSRINIFGTQDSKLMTDDPKYVVSILIVDKDEMADYNLKYHETMGPTDVLSFPYTDPQSQTSDVKFISPPELGTILGDLIICYPIAEEEAVKQHKTPQDLVDFYVDHGLHHLLGHHHE